MGSILDKVLRLSGSHRNNDSNARPVGLLRGEVAGTTPGTSPVASLLAFSHQCQLLVYLPFHVSLTGPGLGSQRPQAPLLRQPCHPASVTAAFPRKSWVDPYDIPQ